MIGTKLGPYEITAKLGEGGMGEVWRAHDTKLKRDVAIKVLPPAFVEDKERLVRFEREAQLLAQLHHPNIASIFGMEESEGTKALVMELVEGPTLADRLESGSLPLEESLSIARQIAEALEEAHEKGIIHRDLKPQNIKASVDGKVKILDFGLAKAMDPVDAASGAGSASQLAASPTLTLEATQMGVILGTAGYMAPEQAKGLRVDRRADIWAFGVVLYETLTGRPLFAGDNAPEITAAVLRSEIDLSALPRAVPSGVRRLLERCLDRDQRRRLQAIGEARVLLEEPQVLLGEGSAQAQGDRTPLRRARLLTALGGLALLATGWLLRPVQRDDQDSARFADLDVANLDTSVGQAPKISPDGTRVAYIEDGQLRVRRLDSGQSIVLPGTDGARYHAWSPDGLALAFAADGRAWSISREGGEKINLGAVPGDLVGSGGAAWTADGQIVFAGSDSVGLWAVPATGGRGQEILALDPAVESDFHEIGALPFSQALIFTVHRRGVVPDRIDLFSEGLRRTLVEVPGEMIRYPAYSPTGHILFERQSTNPGIWSLPFSQEEGQAAGAAFLAIPGGGAPSIAGDGTLSYLRPDDLALELVRLTRHGVVESVSRLPGTTTSMMTRSALNTGNREAAGVSLSPDGKQLALAVGYSPGELFVWDFARASIWRVARKVFPSRPIWSGDGQRLIYSSWHGARSRNLAWRRADGAGTEQRLSTSDDTETPFALLPDHTHLVFGRATGQQTAFAAETISLVEDTTPKPLFESSSFALAASFSPDGRWLAFELDDSGRSEIYVRPFPNGERRFKVSTNGGGGPVWVRSGEIFYRANDGVWGVSVTQEGDTPDFSRPVLLFRTGGETGLASEFDVTPDGQSFYLLRVRGREHLSLVFGWPRELARLAGFGARGSTR